MPNKKILIIGLMCCETLLHAQNFTFKSKIETVPDNGFYRIALSPEISAYANTDMSDLRMFDNNGKEIPFLYKREVENKNNIDFYSYPIESDKANDSTQTIIIRNNSKNKINKLIFELKNAQTDRTVRISGSNDNLKWYVVRDNFYFTLLGYGEEANVQSVIDFPMSDYLFYKIEIKKKNTQELNILKVGYTKDEIQIPSYNKIPGTSYLQKDSSDKKTYIHFNLNPNNRIDKLVFHISAPALFNREGEILIFDEKLQRYKTIHSPKYRHSQYSSEYYFTLNSDNSLQVNIREYLGTKKASKFIIQIENNDNEPLKIDSIEAFQLNASLIANLQKNKNYFLYFGDSLLYAPDYDLVYFQNKIPESLPAIKSGEVLPKNVKIEEEYNQSRDKWFIWVGIGIIALVLCIMTFTMMKNIKKEEN